MLNIFYRISDKSYDKTKLIGATKQFCFQNLINTFKKDNILIIADNCFPETIKWLQCNNPTIANFPSVIQSNVGNAGAVRLAIKYACDLEDDAMVYIVEDDYLYRDVNCSELIEEGLSRSEYVTLYDHPDKYESEYNYGEVCKVFHTPHSHWRHTISTTMTFATRVKTLKKDLDIWMKYTEGNHPCDHCIFSEIAQGPHRLSVCIPGVACHTDLTYSAAKRQILIDNWAIQLMHDHFEKRILEQENQKIKEHFTKIQPLPLSLQKLIMLSSLLQTVEKNP